MIGKLCTCCKKNEARREFTLKEKYEKTLTEVNGEVGWVTLRRKIYMCPDCHKRFMDFMKEETNGVDSESSET